MKTIKYNDKTITIVSTAHVSRQSVEDVKNAIEFVKPDVVCVELDDARAHNLMNPQGNPDIIEIIKSGKVMSFAANLILSSYQKRLADDLGSSVGGEMKAAIEGAKKAGIPSRNIDRDIKITFGRIFNSMSFWEKMNVIATFVTSLFSKEEVAEEDIENLKNADLLLDSMKELEGKLPNISHVLLHERNYYMAERVKAMTYDNILVILGAAHTPGFIESIDQEHDINELKTVKPKKKNPLIQWVLPVTLVLLLVMLTLKNPQIGFNQLLLWLTLSAGGAFLSTLILRTHIYTSIVTLVTAPIGTLSPFLAVGIFAALTEGYKRPPHAKDFENLASDVSSLKMWNKNKVLRLLLIFIITNVVSSIGTFIALGGIISKLLS